MAKSLRNSPALSAEPPDATLPGPPLDLSPWAAWAGQATELAVQSQGTALEFLLGWQQAWAQMHQELWDQWTVHFCGGAPFDA